MVSLLQPRRACHASLHALREQVEELIATNHYREALSLCDLCKKTFIAEVGEEALRVKRSEIHEKFGFHLFAKRQFPRAKEEFLCARGDPRRVLALFPALLPEGVQFQSFLSNAGASVGNAQGMERDVKSPIDKSAVLLLLVPYLNSLRRSENAQVWNEEEKKRRKRVGGSNVFDSLAVTMVSAHADGAGLEERKFQEDRYFSMRSLIRCY